MRRYRNFLLLGICLNMYWAAHAQNADLNVHHLSTNEGLSDGVVRAIGQDRYGYIWIGTVSGINRFDGYKVKKYQSEPKQPGSPPFSVPRDIYGDSKGNLWIGFNLGLYRFDYATEKFLLVNGTENIQVAKIKEDSTSHILYLLTNEGLIAYSPASGQCIHIAAMLKNCPPEFNGNLLQDMDIKGMQLYVISKESLWSVDLRNKSVWHFPGNQLSKEALSNVAVDHDGTIWLSSAISNSQVFSISADRKTTRIVNIYHNIPGETNNNSIREIFIDHQNRLWLTTFSKWLYCYAPASKKLNWFESKKGRSNAISLYIQSLNFQSKNGFLWAATEGFGVDYFHPDNNPFEIISPLDNRNLSMHSSWARSAIEDSSGNIWLGWSSGITKFTADQQNSKNWTNTIGQKQQLHNNSVRALLCDHNNNIWIGTSTGVNLYSPSTFSISFLTAKDSLPPSFYWSIYEDKQKNIWFGSGSGLYYKEAIGGKIHSYKYHPVLATAIDTGVRVIFQDRSGLLWLGMDGSGLTMYDPIRQQVKKWERTRENDSTLLGNSITGITEDKKGLIWISSFNGLVSYDRNNDRFTQYTASSGLPSIKCSGILVDEMNRLWIATTSGLALLDQERKNFTPFTEEDGLPTIEFADMPASRFRNGDFLFPTMKGYVRFNPLKVKPAVDTLDVYLSAINVFDKPFSETVNAEEMTRLHLKPTQNFFSFNLVALNYNNPRQTWYAYKLEGFDKDWIISQSGVANYTNVPGGHYVFRYKAGLTNNPDTFKEKQLLLKIDTFFYKSFWFWLTIIVVAGFVLYEWYRARLRSQEKMYVLQSRAQNLEKEKALVMFEGLKQQLNPHFLFNSLSSLGSLIRTDQALAASFLDSLSKIYRYILQNHENDLTTLDKEIQFVTSYIRLLETRFQKGLQININIEPSRLSQKIVPVTLQNMIDNAIKHNMIDEDRPLYIDIFDEPGYLVIRNNIQKKGMVETSNKQGLRNLISLYKYLTDTPLVIEETGAFFTIKIPLL
ncbi:ligand-binding sensor domain-containing protein [Flavihumibacter fluvii]|uniref:ligand-binding sensor domain-containing protein n=1 Tax=Flavihumibacter fluvii TaxID=2838157 RepID=UPI001BDE893A|nr:two-component regulator propeller domain-containing protein [Flavihumibacter fluvii]ULQ52949.1 histidine kinase [Flavihumibacter fluvii]